MQKLKTDETKPFNSSFGLYDPSKELPLPKQFFRQQVEILSEQLLGKVIVRQTPEGTIRAVIVQTEAYKAPLDKACHAYNNKKTERTKYFWLDGGHLYLYTIYMITNVCLNVVAYLEGHPEAVLIRAVEPIQGLPMIIKARNLKSKKVEDLTNGPGKVGLSLGVKMDMNGIDLMQGELRIVDGGISGLKILTSPRININYAEEWITKPWRFYVEGNKFVSKPPTVKQGAEEKKVEKGQSTLKLASKSKGKQKQTKKE